MYISLSSRPPPWFDITIHHEDRQEQIEKMHLRSGKDMNSSLFVPFFLYSWFCVSRSRSSFTPCICFPLRPSPLSPPPRSFQPPDCKSLIEEIKSASMKSPGDLTNFLKTVKIWTVGKCELYHWIDVLDIFDSILENVRNLCR